MKKDDAQPIGVQAHKVALACAWVLFIALLSFLPRPLKEVLHTTGRLHLFGHILAFSSAAFLIVGATRNAQTRIALIFMTLAFGYSVEIAQHFVYGTQIELTDMVMDTFGSILGLLVGIPFSR